MSRNTLFAAALFAAFVAVPAEAQQRGGTAVGGQGFGTTGGTAVGGGGFGTTQGGAGGQSLGQGGINLDAGGASGVDRTFTGDFVGGSDTSTRFVGNAAAGTQQGLTRQPNFRALSGAIQTFDQPTPPRSPIRTQLRIGFAIPPQNTVPAFTTFSPRGQTPGLSRVDPSLRAEQIGGTTVLRGTVANDHERKLAEALLRLEPGVRTVASEVRVQPGSGAPPSSPSPIPSVLPAPTMTPLR